jgi:hypothetical protein
MVAPEVLPGFFHEGQAHTPQWYCLTVRGEPHCTCGRYALCDPLVVACNAACLCACHAVAEGIDA